MAGELCGRWCGWCGRCDAEPDDVCDCGRSDCRGECADAVDMDRVDSVDQVDDVERGEEVLR